MRKKRGNIIEEEYKQYGGENGYEFVSNSWFESQRREEGSILPKLLQILSALVLGIVLIILVKVGYKFWFEEDEAKIIAQAQTNVGVKENSQNQPSSLTKDRTTLQPTVKVEKAQVIGKDRVEPHKSLQATKMSQEPPAQVEVVQKRKENTSANQEKVVKVENGQKKAQALEGEKLVQYLLSLPPDQLEKIDVKKLLLSKKVPKTQNAYLNNQVVVEKNEPVVKNDELARLSEELESIIEPEVKKVKESVPVKDTSYIKGLEKEAVVRKKNMRYYVVQPGDTLSKIAAKFYGSGKEYIKIYEANQDIISKPELIYPGQKLRIPAL